MTGSFHTVVQNSEFAYGTKTQYLTDMLIPFSKIAMDGHHRYVVIIFITVVRVFTNILF